MFNLNFSMGIHMPLCAQASRFMAWKRLQRSDFYRQRFKYRAFKNYENIRTGRGLGMLA